MQLFKLSICKITKINLNCLAIIDIPQLFYKCEPCEVLTNAVSSNPGVRELRATCLTRIISDPPLLHGGMGEGGGLELHGHLRVCWGSQGDDMGFTWEPPLCFSSQLPFPNTKGKPKYCGGAACFKEGQPPFGWTKSNKQKICNFFTKQLHSGLDKFSCYYTDPCRLMLGSQIQL